MIKFANLYRPIIGGVYEQMDNMLGQIKDIVEPRNITLLIIFVHRWKNDGKC